MKKIVLLIGLISIIILGGCDSNSINSSNTKTDIQTNVEECQHSYSIATCTEPSKCTICGKTLGEPNGHNWSPATCTTAKKCTICGKTEGNALGHSWAEATCSSPKKCSVCGITEGNVSSCIDNGNGYCKFCNKDIILNDFKKTFLSS